MIGGIIGGLGKGLAKLPQALAGASNKVAETAPKGPVTPVPAPAVAPPSKAGAPADFNSPQPDPITPDDKGASRRAPENKSEPDITENRSPDQTGEDQEDEEIEIGEAKRAIGSDVEENKQEAEQWGQLGPEQERIENEEIGRLGQEHSVLQARAILVEQRLLEEGKKIKKIRDELRLLKKDPEKFFGKPVMRQFDTGITYTWVASTLLVDLTCMILDLFSLGLLGFITPLSQFLTLFLLQMSFKKRGNKELKKMDWKKIKQYVKQLIPAIPLLTIYFIKTRRTHNKDATEDQALINRTENELKAKLLAAIRIYELILSELNELQSQMAELEAEMNTRRERLGINSELAGQETEYTKSDSELGTAISATGMIRLTEGNTKKLEAYGTASQGYVGALQRKANFESAAQSDAQQRAQQTAR